MLPFVKLVHQAVQPSDVGDGGALGGEPSRHAFERCHDCDHLDNLALCLAHDKDAAARPGPDKAFLLEQGHRLADRRAAYPKPRREPPLVEPDLLRVAVDVHRGDRPLQRGIGFLAEGGAGVQPRHIKDGPVYLFDGARGGFGHSSGIWYTRELGNPGPSFVGEAVEAEASALPRALYSAAARFGVGSNGRPG